jgi:hypothetical protein
VKNATEDGVAYLKRLLRYQKNPQFTQMVNDRDSVYREYGRVFDPANLGRLTDDEFKGFLLYENNRHWWGIHRHQARVVADMGRLRYVLGVLLDESRPIVDRLNWIEPTAGPKPLPGIGPAVITPILHVVYPDRYGVWNSISESAMRRLGLWPRFRSGDGFGRKYTGVTSSIQTTATKVGVDLWTIDSLWWLCELEHEPSKHQFAGGGAGSSGSHTDGARSRAGSTFVCENCFQTKPNNLRSVDTNLCIDCNPDVVG